MPANSLYPRTRGTIPYGPAASQVVCFIAGLYAVIGGATSFTGWALDLRRLTDWNNNGISIQPNATLCVTFSGLVLLLLVANRRRWAAVPAGLVLLIGGSTLLEWISGLSFGHDALLVFGREWGRVGVVHVGRMGPPGSLSWTLIGAALVLTALPPDRGRWRRLAPALALITLAISAVSLAGYLYGADLLYTIPRMTVIAMQTATFVMAVSLGIIASHPDREPMRTLIDGGAAGIIARRIVPLLLVVALGLGFLRVATHNAGLMDVPTGVAIMFLLTIALLAAPFWWTLGALRTREARLRQSEERFRTLVSVITDVPWTTDANGAFVVDQPAWAAYTGQSQKELRGFGWASALHPDDRDTVKAIWERACASKSLYESRGRLWHAPTQKYRHFVARATPVFDDRGVLREWVGTCTDVHNQTLAEQALRDSEARHRALIQVSVYGVITIDEHGIIETANPAAERQFGYSSSELIGRNVSMLMPAPYQAEHDAYLQNYLRTGVRKIIGIGREVVGRRKDGSTFPMDLAVAEFQVGGKRYFNGIVIDITERKQADLALDLAREQAEAASTAKDRFLAVLSHELRTPLAPVLMSISAMHLNPKLPEALREDVAMIRRNVELEARLIDDLLDLSRVTAGKLRLKTEAVEVNSAVRHVCETCRPYILEKAIRLHCELPDQSPFVTADPARLQQVLWNLLRNAVKFTPEGGDIFVTVASIDDQRVRIQVRDTGIGIAPEVLPKIFDAFEQGDANVTRQFGGLGLGLAVSRALVEMHDGTIRAESAGRGKGSVFTVELPELPLDQVPRAPLEELRGKGGNGDDGPLRVLVVEDHPDTADVLARILSSSGHSVRTAHTAASALELAANEPFEVIVSDIGLPDATGYELMKQIRARHAMKGIAMSGYGTDEDIRKSQEAGFSDHIVKPANMTELERAIRRVARMAVASADIPPQAR